VETEHPDKIHSSCWRKDHNKQQRASEYVSKSDMPHSGKGCQVSMDN